MSEEKKDEEFLSPEQEEAVKKAKAELLDNFIKHQEAAESQKVHK